jgi:hypothetical protein
MLERFDGDKYSNSFGPFLSFKENEVLWIQPLYQRHLAEHSESVNNFSPSKMQAYHSLSLKSGANVIKIPW